VLAENVEHHVKEEESTIFTLAPQLLKREELDELGAEMQKAKARLIEPSRTGAKKAPQKKAARQTSRRA
jgi:hemerythrin-like domain-containing protein